MNVIHPFHRALRALFTRLPVFFLILSLCFAQRTHAQGTIFYQATDLADTTPGQDLWRYNYVVSGFSFQANQGFSVFFAPLAFTQLQNPPPLVNADWSVLSIQPDLVLHDPGFYDAQAQKNDPSFSD